MMMIPCIMSFVTFFLFSLFLVLLFSLTILHSLLLDHVLHPKPHANLFQLLNKVVILFETLFFDAVYLVFEVQLMKILEDDSDEHIEEHFLREDHE